MFTFAQIATICIFYGLWTFIGYSCQFFVYGSTVLVGWVTGMVMGDATAGLLIGGTLQLMSLGVGGWGGSSVPNYAMGTVVGVAFAVATGNGLDAGLAIGIPVAALGVQLDVFGKTAGSFFLHKAMACSEKMDWKGMKRWIWLDVIPKVGLAVLPILLVMTAGATVVEVVLNNIPGWLLTGMNVAGGMLPALGFAILLKYLPTKKYATFLILGFVLTAYFASPMLGTALIGGAAAYFIFNSLNEKAENQAVAGGNYDE